MTIVSTTNPVTLEEALDIAEQRAFEKRTPSFPPIEDDSPFPLLTGDVRERCRGSVNNVGLVLALVVRSFTTLAPGLATSNTSPPVNTGAYFNLFTAALSNSCASASFAACTALISIACCILGCAVSRSLI